MNFLLNFNEVAKTFRGKRVALVGSGPSVLDNSPGFVDSFDLVCRVNNYRTGPAQGYRTDVFFSFFGTSIKKTAAELIADGVTLCMNKCPNDKPISCDWHERTGRTLGIDFRYIYRNRANWWFCDTWVPSTERFLRSFEMLQRHIPTTGFAAILDIVECQPKTLFLTGFDFFESGLHNVNERWRAGDPADPIGHRPDLERDWLMRNLALYPIDLDERLEELMAEGARA